MKKLIKTLVFVAILLTTTVTTAYALRPEQPNLTDLLQSIIDYLENIITPSISDLNSDLASHGTNVIAEIQQSEANITNVVEQSEANIISEINTTHSTLETRLDAVPIMESYEGVWNGTLAKGEYATITNIGYTSIANFQVTMYASFPGTNYLASAFMSVYDEQGNSYTFNVGDTVRDGNQAYTVTFSSKRCWLRVLRGSNAIDEGQVIVSWAVTATYVP